MALIAGFFPSATGLLFLFGAMFFPIISKPQEKIPQVDQGGLVKDESSKPSSRLPTHFSRLGLSADQTKAVLQIQARFQEEMRQLNKKLADLKNGMKKELLEVLGPEQKSRLEELRKSAKASEKD
jgi:hypothetical protein